MTDIIWSIKHLIPSVSADPNFTWAENIDYIIFKYVPQVFSENVDGKFDRGPIRVDWYHDESVGSNGAASEKSARTAASRVGGQSEPKRTQVALFKLKPMSSFIHLNKLV
ncbi:hypothetical protein M5689_025067 [Euphorbia peplus]|nr:hypothetical protein M5689_025067 [Euphorbia peplus]